MAWRINTSQHSDPRIRVKGFRAKIIINERDEFEKFVCWHEDEEHAAMFDLPAAKCEKAWRELLEVVPV